MKKIIFIATICLALVGVLMVSCESHTFNEIAQKEDPIKTVSYNNDVKPIMSNNCISCHGSSSPSAGLSLTTYTQVRNSTEKGGLLCKINASCGVMPQSGKMPQPLINTINSWATQGYNQ